MSVRITYVTHSTTTDSEAGSATGWNPGVLSALGLEQARELGERYAEARFDSIYVSDLARAVDSATIAFGAGAFRLDPRLRECNYGTRNGTPIARAERIEHAIEPFPSGESYADVVERMRALLLDLSARHQGEHVLLVAHSAPRVALDHLLNRVPLAEAVALPNECQPGWSYLVPDETDL